MLAATSHAAEVSGLKQKLERAEGELVLVKRQLEESRDTKYPAYILIKEKWFLLTKAS